MYVYVSAAIEPVRECERKTEGRDYVCVSRRECERETKEKVVYQFACTKTCA